ncbi:hypothetical protein DWB77_05046 [Streptomyces hundungensis]|uniref:DUF397 domain-containing protein n=1 Tax=Streptomyces hundungensis TaxID=1077946 RepID=A0A387HPF7_9ACTN|nr:DUF397 domain-containing protein [Streptomyces hundungensis]AYG82858.1 hypothetical protein DWB77_05046 [Streptomyces hundungensis]
MTTDRIIPRASALTGWRKSSYSGPDEGSCVEIADTDWRKSSYSGPDEGDCVEIADGHTTVPVRDSKNPDGPALLLGAESFTAFIDALKDSAL